MTIRNIIGFSLVELMIVIAIISILSAIAIPAYNGYIREAQFSTARANMDTLKLFLEDWRLDNDSYEITTGDADLTSSTGFSDYGWSPDGDGGNYTYTLETTSQAYSILVEMDDIWIRCEERMSTCCDSTTTGSSKTACSP